ncbi:MULTISPECIES: hypothetical protein [Sphingobacterium]|uniref:hypothetical protein n=1 Tax=Sphingobacterium TaxID=28453 RepID=UPI0013DD6A57|nr:MULTISPECIES: hypothetical protein [unclassified Sphingobacterium]
MKKIEFLTIILFAFSLSACTNRNDSNGSDTQEREPVNQYNAPTDTSDSATDSIIPPTPAPIDN